MERNSKNYGSSTARQLGNTTEVDIIEGHNNTTRNKVI